MGLYILFIYFIFLNHPSPSERSCVFCYICRQPLIYDRQLNDCSKLGQTKKKLHMNHACMTAAPCPQSHDCILVTWQLACIYTQLQHPMVMGSGFAMLLPFSSRKHPFDKLDSDLNHMIYLIICLTILENCLKIAIKLSQVM